MSLQFSFVYRQAGHCPLHRRRRVLALLSIGKIGELEELKVCTFSSSTTIARLIRCRQAGILKLKAITLEIRTFYTPNGRVQTYQMTHSLASRVRIARLRSSPPLQTLPAARDEAYRNR